MTNETTQAVGAPLERGVRQHVGGGFAVESLTWTPVDVATPDDEVTVLCWLEPGGEWFSGWHEAGRWHDAAHGGPLDNVTYWAEPVGPCDA